jgi:magnesium transporter
MLTLYGGPAAAGSAETADAAAVWIDLVSPTPEETARAEAILGGPLPSLGALSEIESSSRLRRREGVLYMSAPSAAARTHGEPAVNPVGFVLSPGRLITIRFMSLPAFDAVARSFADGAGADVPTSGRQVFAGLCEEIVDRIADGLEHLAEEVRTLSVAAFHNDDAKGRHPVRANRLLRIQLRQVGRLGDRLSEVRDGLLGLGRMAAYVEQFGCDGVDETFKGRLASLRQDIHSLTDYEEQLAGKVQFLLDALVGLIGIAQNDVFKVLTIVSIVGIPPTLMAGVYGMNFKNMPEYDWAWGYQWGWGVLIVSALIPLVWFKIKGWF